MRVLIVRRDAMYVLKKIAVLLSARTDTNPPMSNDVVARHDRLPPRLAIPPSEPTAGSSSCHAHCLTIRYSIQPSSTLLMPEWAVHPGNAAVYRSTVVIPCGKVGRRRGGAVTGP